MDDSAEREVRKAFSFHSLSLLPSWERGAFFRVPFSQFVMDNPPLYIHTHTAISPATSSSAVSEREKKKRKLYNAASE